jgi:hypothetical protein
VHGPDQRLEDKQVVQPGDQVAARFGPVEHGGSHGGAVCPELLARGVVLGEVVPDSELQQQLAGAYFKSLTPRRVLRSSAAMRAVIEVDGRLARSAPGRP